MGTTSQNSEEPVLRTLSVAGLWLLIVNGMVGAGIFGVPAEAARLAGAFSPWVFVICALLQLPVVLCFARLASYFTGTGGPVLYAGTAFGAMCGFQAGWCLYTARLLAFAANTNLLVSSFAYLMGGTASPGWRILMLFSVCGLLAIANAAGVRGAIRWLSALTVLKFAPLIALIFVGIPKLRPDLQFPNSADHLDLGAAILLVMYVYTGFESGLVVAGEARHPRRDLPRALLAGLITCALLYALIQSVSIAALPDLASSNRPLVDVAEALVGSWGALVLAAAAVVSITANLFGNMFSSPRITYRLALEGHLPKFFCSVHPTYRTPLWSIAFFSAASFVLAATSGFVWLASLSVLARLAVWLTCIAALPRLNRHFATEDRGLRSAAVVFLPVVAVLVCLALLSQVKFLAYVSVAGLVAVGSVLFLIQRRPPLKQEALGRSIDG
jgi:amino acid transporter